ncbi:MAG: hypothetical protein M2R45_04362 [Verrucomicrobia subdivision 3 bacterium]|nr:hypothetical protein [Limisphaerales bacterium]MCS1416067.1 hypothetical protein [Limisphaerales bacterium]
MTDHPQQLSLNFDEPTKERGYRAWLKERTEVQRKLVQELRFPLNKNVEVWLQGNVRLEGKLELAPVKKAKTKQEKDDLLLRIGRATFHYREIMSCININ